MSKKRDFRLQHEITERVAAQAHASVLEERIAHLTAVPAPPAPAPAPAPPTFRQQLARLPKGSMERAQFSVTHAREIAAECDAERFGNGPEAA